jgi:hypothetical protein
VAGFVAADADAGAGVAARFSLKASVVWGGGIAVSAAVAACRCAAAACGSEGGADGAHPSRPTRSGAATTVE